MTSSAEITHHYDAETSPRGILRHARWFWSYAVQIQLSRVLVWNFFRRSLLGRFRGSFGGFFWVLVQPVFQFLIYYMVFGVLFARPEDLAHGPDPTLAFYLFAGVLLFGTIQESAGQGLNCIVTNSNLVKKVAFPCELLPLTPVLVAAIVYLIGCVLLLLVGLTSGHTAITWELLWWPLVIVCLVLFCTGLGLLLGAANVFVRDVSQLWPIISMAWFFSSPVFWRVSLIKEKVDAFGEPWLMDLLLLNPAYGMLIAQRQVFGIGHNLPPADRAELYYHSLPVCLASSLGWAVLTFFLGYGLFMSRKHKFADLV